MGCALSCLEHAVWSRFYDGAVRASSGPAPPPSAKVQFLSALDRVPPKELSAVYCPDSNRLEHIAGVSLDGRPFTIRLTGGGAAFSFS